MARQSVLHFFPERIVWIGAAVLGLGFLFTLPYIWMMNGLNSPSLSMREKKEKVTEVAPYSFTLGLKDNAPGLSIPDLHGEMTFSFDPPRPDGVVDGKRLLVRMKHSGESKRVTLPCRLDLEFQGDRLSFAKGESLFWMELSAVSGQIVGKGFITTLDGTKIDAGSFIVSGQDCPIQGAQEFVEGSPFRLLAEARWWGRDQFRPSGESGERLEIGASELLELQDGDWLIWKEGRWQKSEKPEKDLPIAHIQSSLSKTLTLEGWGSEGHTRIALGSAVGPVFKMKGEDLFGSIRIRSEKQISCMLEKQCMVLKTGDWVLKTGGRWKILRKKDERDAFLNGKLFGELFILEQISQKQGQKMIQGRLFNPGRTQVVSIEMPAHSARKMGEKGSRKGRSP
jgi:hypothetical protein